MRKILQWLIFLKYKIGFVFYPKKGKFSYSFKNISFLDCKIHGTRFYECRALLRLDELQIGMCLQLIQEPENSYDKYAVEILTVGGEKLGYIPKKYSQLVFKEMGRSSFLEAKIIAINPFAWDPIYIALILK